jgi:ArsR family transcriptional regulator
MQDFPTEKVRAASQGLRAIAHELRLTVLCLLLDGPMCVNELQQLTGASQSNLSQHLAKMRMMGLLESEKRGQQVYYRLAHKGFADIIYALKQIYCPELCEKDS